MGKIEVIKKEPQDEIRCRKGCPAGIDVPKFIRLSEQGKFEEALAVIRENNPFPSVTGHTCLAFCERKCRRAEIDAPVGINAIERFITDQVHGKLTRKRGKRRSSGRLIGIVGSGPAGLTAAYYLAAQAGHSVTVFEEFPEVGGMMRYGIPFYRLPKEVLAYDVDHIKSMGVSFRTNTKIESPDRLQKEGFDAVLWAAGAGQGYKLPIPGADLFGVLVGLPFLEAAVAGNEVKVGKKVVVLGGGNVAFDCARSAMRLGASDVRIICLEPRDAMLASRDEIEEAEEEGTVIHHSNTVKKIIGHNGRVTGVECVKIKTFWFDDGGKAHIDPVEGSEHILPSDTVIFAVGQLPDLEPIRSANIRMTVRGTIDIDPSNLSTSDKGVFAAGDVITGTSSVIEAVAAGKKAAISIDRFLGGNNINFGNAISREESPKWHGFDERILDIGRLSQPVLPKKERTYNFDEVKLGYSKEMAKREMNRCLHCDQSILIGVDIDKCTNCYTCQLTCSLVYQGVCNPEKARILIGRDEINYSIECVAGCSLCVQHCPQDALLLKW